MVFLFLYNSYTFINLPGQQREMLCTLSLMDLTTSICLSFNFEGLLVLCRSHLYRCYMESHNERKLSCYKHHCIVWGSSVLFYKMQKVKACSNLTKFYQGHRELN